MVIDHRSPQVVLVCIPVNVWYAKYVQYKLCFDFHHFRVLFELFDLASPVASDT